MAPINLICLPYAGGNIYSYNAFRKYLDGKLNMVSPELPGRGEFYGEPFVKDLHLMADILFGQLERRLSEPYAFYGHSMGGILAYLLARRIKRERMPEPFHLFCSGCKAPSIPPTHEFFKLADNELIAQLRAYGGSPEDVLNNHDLMEFMLPIIRADFEAAETFEYRPGPKLNTGITVFRANEDDVSQQDAETWQTETNKPISVLSFSGDHFFILEKSEEVCNVILRTLNIV
jgi:surfactin synthase thioesterase subunit